MGNFKTARHRPFLIIGMLIIVLSCNSNQHLTRKGKTEKYIALKFNENSPEIIFENNVSVIHLEKTLLISDIKKRLEEKNLCEQKIIKYNKLIENLAATEQNLYFIEKAIDPKLSMELIKTDDNKVRPGDSTGYAPIDFYSRQLGYQMASDYIAPYGFNPLTDTTAMVRIKPFFEWMVYDLLLEGKGKVFNKKQNAFDRTIINEVISEVGFGGSCLLFSNKNIFYNVYVSSCLIMPETECMDSTEFKQWER